MIRINASILRRDILDEILRVFRLPVSDFTRAVFLPIFGFPVNRFSEMVAEFDDKTARQGFRQATADLITRFIEKVEVAGAEYIPKEGPLLLVSNHPGTYDSLVISSNIPRDDYKILVGNIDFLRLLPNASNKLIFSYRADQTQARANVVRSSIQHLKEGGALLLFPSGRVDPDPAVQPGTLHSLRQWSRSVALILREAPQTRLMITFVSGVLEKRLLNNPLLFLQQEEWEKRRLAEFIQVIRQMLFRGRRIPQTQVSFTAPIEPSTWNDLKDTRSLMNDIQNRAKESFTKHMVYWKNRVDGYFQP